MLTLILLYLRLSDFCKSPDAHQSPVMINEFDIPFEKCSVQDFSNKNLITNYSIIQNYHYRTLRLDNKLTLTVNEVTSGDILTIIDVLEATLILNLARNIKTIYGNIRVNKENGAKLIVNGGSFHAHQQKLIRFIHTNDIHCSYEESKEDGKIGIAKLVSYIKNERKNAKENGYSVLAVDCGDFNQGLPLCNLNNGTTGRDLMKIANYDAFTIGNHEWDFGHINMFEYKKFFDEFQAPLICSNVIDSTPEQEIKFNPYVIKIVDGLRVGIFALLTPTTNVTTNPQQVKYVTFIDDIVGQSKKYTAILRNEEKCDIVVAISHLGYEQGLYTSNILAEAYDGIDVIIDGHSHTTLDNGSYRLNNDFSTLIAQTGSNLKKIGNVDIIVDAVTKKVIGKKAKLLYYDDVSSLEGDSEASSYLKKAVEKVEQQTKIIVGKTLIDLDNERESVRKLGRSKLADFVTSAMLFTAKTDSVMAVINGGGVRSNIPKGDINWGNIASILPYGNMIVVIDMTGQQIKDFLKFGTRLYGEEEFGGFPMTSGISYSINLNEKWDSHSRITDLKIIGIDGKSSTNIDDEKHYGVAMTDFIYLGGDGYENISDLPRINQYGTEMNAVIQYLNTHKDSTITGNEDIFKYNRINIKGEFPVKVRKERKVIKRQQIKESTANVIINNGHLNIMDVEDVAFSNFTVEAKMIIASNLKDIEIVANTKVGYIGNKESNIYLAGGDDLKNYVYGLDPNSENVVGSNIECNGLFRIFKNGKCRTNSSFIAIFVFMFIFMGCSIGFIVFFLLTVFSKTRKASGGSTTMSLYDMKA
ncbi:hypothetical protein TRFO_15593 [Tritrichomonas foetus]|uniref:5'-nucleotidase n=1 Tax=Tritrichomonas foetus TaxID=1144522 RepID=A0A1J4KX03_9EUKA|nr:hypothetical protein TRFO_15593 [Tritrichomonas foetus]|eukprot:OHT14077.1 hypothetical protein TRFO_15593 [Tritrichomonas foetus]